MRISRALFDELVAHAREDAPDECCGIVAARGDQATAVHRMENVFHTPVKYEMSPSELFSVWKQIDDAGDDVGAIYHSHTRTAPYPSQTDINLATWPDSLYIIIGVRRGSPDADVRAYTIRDGQVGEAQLTVV